MVQLHIRISIDERRGTAARYEIRATREPIKKRARQPRPFSRNWKSSVLAKMKNKPGQDEL